MKVTHEDFLHRLFLKNPNIEPLEQYKGSATKILCRCKICGNEWMVTPGNLLSGKGCPPCSRKRNTINRTKKQENFIAELSENNPNVVSIEPYKGTNTKIYFRCMKCNHEWAAKPSHILAGHGCPVCGGSMRKDNSVFVDQLSKINPLIEPLEPYINARQKILCHCKHCDNEWYGTPDKLLQGNGCPKCDMRHKTSFPEQAIYYYLKKVYPDALNRYYIPHTKTELDIFLPSLSVGLEYDGVYWHKSKSEHDFQKYQICQQHGITLYRLQESNEVREDSADRIFIRNKPYNFETLDTLLKKLFSYLDVTISVNTLEDSAKIREEFFTELLANSLSSLYPKVAQEWHQEKNSTLTPKMISYGSNEKYWWKCSECGNEWFAAVASRTTRNRGCPVCFRNKLSLQYKKKNDLFLEELATINPNLEPLEEYKTTHEKILIRCKVCGNEWLAAPANLLRGKDCPKCSRKRANAKLSEIKKEYHRVKQKKE